MFIHVGRLSVNPDKPSKHENGLDGQTDYMHIQIDFLKDKDE